LRVAGGGKGESAEESSPFEREFRAKRVRSVFVQVGSPGPRREGKQAALPPRSTGIVLSERREGNEIEANRSIRAMQSRRRLAG